MVRLHGHQVGGVVLPDSDLAGGGAVPAANLQHRVGGLDDSPHRLVSQLLDVAVRGVKVLIEEVALLASRDTCWWEV